MIAMAIACKPQLIADEPTTALDNRSKGNYPVVERHSARNGNEYHLSHDLSLVSAIAHRVVVMYQGEIIGAREVKQILKSAT
jgi:peptide/nickel transport system ATP-binding protein